MKKQLIRLSLVAGLLALFIPTVASAQGWPWPDNRRDDRDYRRDRDYGRYDTRYLRDSIHRLDRLAKDFERELDRELDRDHREDGTRHEDRVNNVARQFRDSVGDLKSAFGNGRDLNRSSDEAQRVFNEANRTERATRHHFDSHRVASLWSQIRRELNVIRNAYGQGGYYGSNDDWRRDRRNDNRNDIPWWERIIRP
jgi:hypothetical protein